MTNHTELRIAYADDHTIVRKGISALLNAMGGLQVVIEADNGKHLIEQLERATELPDVCMLDINMPEMNGFEAIAAIRKQWPGMGILVLTVFDTEYYFIRMVMSGANGYLLKSCNPEEIRNALHTIYKNGVYYADAVARNYFQAMRNNEIKLPTLTETEERMLKLCCTDSSFSEIAEMLGMPIRTFERNKEQLFNKVGVNSRVGLAIFAVQFGLVPLELNTSELKNKNQ